MGRIPECLEGVYLCDGANPRFEPSAGHHLFDGDVMIHAVRLKQGRYTRLKLAAVADTLARIICLWRRRGPSRGLTENRIRSTDCAKRGLG